MRDAGRAARAARARRATSRAADGCASEIAALGWEVRDGAGGFELLAAVIVYGRNPVREALRGRRAHGVERGLGDERRRARAVAASASRSRIASAEEIERRCGSSAHQGVCAEAGGYPYVSAAGAARRAASR